MNRQDATADMYDCKSIEPTKIEYEGFIRDSLIDYEIRTRDLADEKREKFTKTEIERLDKKFGITAKY